MFLKEIEETARRRSEEPEKLAEMPDIQSLFAYRPDSTEHLARFTHEVMRGPSELSPGQRELIAAFTSDRNGCPF